MFWLDFLVWGIFEELVELIPIRIRKTIAAFFLIIGIPLLLFGWASKSTGSGLAGLLIFIIGFILVFLAIVLYVPGQFSLFSYSEGSTGEQGLINCPECKQTLNIPLNYTGLISCPPCQEKIFLNDGFLTSDYSIEKTLITKSDINDDEEIITSNESLDEKQIISYAIEENQLSVGLSVVGVITGLLAIYLFFSAFGMDAWCPEENRIEHVESDGEVWYSCEDSGSMWDGMMSRLFFSCCLFVPLSVFFTIQGFNLRKSSQNVLLSTDSGQDSQVIKDPKSTSDKLVDSPTIGALQSIAKWFSLGMLAIVVIIGLLITLLFIWVIYEIGKSDGLFA